MRRALRSVPPRSIALTLAVLGTALSILPAAHRASAARPLERPIPAIARVLIVSIDGLRGDVLLRATTPDFQSLLAFGSYTMWAQTTDPAVTLPSHVSMLTGVPPEKHGITWNDDRPGRYPAWPTLFELAHAAGYTTAMAAGKSKFHAFEKPGALDWSFVPGEQVVDDRAVGDTAVAWIARYRPRVFFVHLPGVDSAGHRFGWGSPQQVEAIRVAGSCIGRMLETLRVQHALDSTLVIVTSDHGGAGRSHGAGDPRSRFIPWMAAGPGVCGGVDLTGRADLTVRTEDTFATAAYVLGITPAQAVDGRPVMAIFCGAARAHTAR